MGTAGLAPVLAGGRAGGRPARYPVPCDRVWGQRQLPGCPVPSGSLPPSCLRGGTRFLCWHRVAVPPPRHCPRNPKGLPGGKAGLSGAHRAGRVLLPAPSPMAGLWILCPAATWGPQPHPLGCGGLRCIGGPFSITLKPLGDECMWSWAAGVALPISRLDTPPGMPMSSHLHGTAVTQLGCLCPGGLSHPGRVLPPLRPPVLPREGEASLDHTPSGKRDTRVPLLELVPVHPPYSWEGPPFVLPGHPVLAAGEGEPVCRTRRSCAAEAAQRLAGKGCGCLHKCGGPGAGCAEQLPPTLHLHAGTVCRRQPDALFLHPHTVHWDGGLSRVPRLGSGPVRSVSVTVPCPVL
ncbi:uncharacterized protein LOC129734403 [Falco cherrug]|uniref:uncharacterized protein LOC129734403 n=1 Tax=Falco cherrug TaxID=345164 RepID=UPI00247A47DB|nr:uncharacterized protein LOC129734403 [Falco cherrug]